MLSPVRDREQAKELVIDIIMQFRHGKLSMPAAVERIVDALLPQPDPQGGDAHAPGVQPGTVVARAGDGGESIPGLCPLCGTPVRVVSGDEGTSHYEPLPEPGAGRADQKPS